MRWLAIIGLLASISSAAAAELLDVPAVAMKTKEQVDRVLGKPARCEKTKYGPKCAYRGGKVEVVYIAGRADWITIHPTGTMSLYDVRETITGLHLPAIPWREPRRLTDGYRWEGWFDLVEITSFGGPGGQIDYVYVKASTR